jgi:hypothetical protein
LHREVDRFVAHAASKGHRTFISTNVGRLDRVLSERLILAGLTSIHLCVDGATPDAHEAYRVGSDFEQVRRNCAEFTAARSRLGRINPRAIIQTLLTRHSEGQIADVVQWASGIGADEVFFKTLSQGTGLTPDQRAAGVHLVPLSPDLKRRPAGTQAFCSQPTEQTIVYWNGDLGVCCVDFNNMAALPNIEPDGLCSTLVSAAVDEARQKGVRGEHALCRSCHSRTSGPKGVHIDLAEVRQAGPLADVTSRRLAEQVRQKFGQVVRDADASVLRQPG